MLLLIAYSLHCLSHKLTRVMHRHLLQALALAETSVLLEKTVSLQTEAHTDARRFTGVQYVQCCLCGPLCAIRRCRHSYTATAKCSDTAAHVQQQLSSPAQP
eukprot:GHRQ01010832.1.p1 GENE.GHRQ01010832.1~~GHRQ01010832.1.p1  ORF type:complete len:102 (-),score=10.39 GHRQ01010832.1:477-782(-)